MAEVTVENTVISIIQVNEEDFISLTDIAKYLQKSTIVNIRMP